MLAQTESEAKNAPTLQKRASIYCWDSVSRDQPFHTKFRRTRPGPEADLVDQFLASDPLKPRSKGQLAIFKEPWLLSGAPDLVAVYWSKDAAKCWRENRARIPPEAFRVAQALTNLGPQTDEVLMSLFQRRAIEYLSSLEACGIIKRVGKRWRLTGLKLNFATSCIVAFEAKIRDPKAAIRQAALNLWFASQSYILIPRLPKRKATFLEMAEEASVGVWVVGNASPFLKSGSGAQKQPVSYASWLLNDWAWKFSPKAREGDTRDVGPEMD